MSVDISRLLHQPIKHYTSLNLQQGRVLLDSDFNESAVLDEEDQRRLWLDVVGPEGSPDLGFTIAHGIPLSDSPLPFSPEDPPPEPGASLRSDDPLDAQDVLLADENGVLTSTPIYNVAIRPGTMFLGGLRHELERLESFVFQRDYLQLRASDLPGVFGGTGEEARYLYFLHAWEQSVSVVEDQELAEAMLRGADTSVRVRRMRRVEVRSTDAENCTDAFEELINELEGVSPGNETSEFDRETFELKSRARLQLVFKPGETGDPCGPCAPSASFQGSQNATLRIMLAAADRFVWALDNGGPLYRVKVDVQASTVELLAPPASEEQIPLRGRVIELLPFAALLDGGDVPNQPDDPHFRKVAAEVGVFGRVEESYDPATRAFSVQIDEDAVRALVSKWDESHPDAARLNAGTSDPNVRYFYMRMWHQSSGDVTLPVPRDADGDTLGDTGIVPVFTNEGRPGDYWVAALRVADATRVVPFDLLNAGGVAPHGPRHFYTPLSLLHLRARTDVSPVSVVVGENGDCRSRLRRIGDQGCFTFTVGDGVSSTGDFESIQAAIEALPASGGRIGIRPGVYDEKILIEDRRDVVLEGCGAGTVIESPVNASGTLLEIRDSESITLSGLTLRAVEQTAILARRVTDLTLRGVATISGTLDEDGEFLPDTAEGSAPLVLFSQVASADVEAMTLQPAQRPGLMLSACELVSIRDLSANGVAVSPVPPLSPLVSIDSSELVKLEDSTLRPFGQIGVAVRGSRARDIELRGLTILASSNFSVAPSEVATASESDLEDEDRSPIELEPPSDTEEDEKGEMFDTETATETQPAIDIENGDGIRVAKCRIRLDGSTVSEHAALVVRGRNIVVEGNTVQAIPECHDSAPESPLANCLDVRAAFGGIQIRGNSTGVEIRKNRIRGGLGHGITIGSVLWHVAGTSPRRARRVGGAGTGQLTPVVQGSPHIALGRNVGAGFDDDEGVEWVPVDEGLIRDLVIADNDIQDMFASGISVITVLGLLQRGGDLIEVEACRIEGNTIHGNLLRVGLDLPDIGDVLPFPGSVYGPSVISVLPFGGIVLAAATGGLDIVNNVIRDNAIFDVQSPESPLERELDRMITVPINGVFVLNGEGLNISGNRVTENGTAATSTLSPRAGVRAGIAVMLAGTGAADDIGDLRYVLANRGGLSSVNSSLRLVNNTVVQPEGRALHVVSTGPVTVDGNYFSSRGNHGSDLTTDRFAIGDVVFVQNLGRPWEASQLEGVLDGDDVEGYTAAERAVKHLTDDEDNSPRLFIGNGGNLLFNNNQVVYEWKVARQPPNKSTAPLSYFPAVLLGLDHVGVNGNQFALRLDRSGVSGQPRPPLRIASAGNLPPARELLLAQVLVLGGTVEVTRNRSAEQVGSTLLSFITNGEIMNITTLNQTTHVNYVSRHFNDRAAVANVNELRDEHNQVLFVLGDDTSNSPRPPSNVRAAVRSALQATFIRLLQDRKQ